ncbi:MAG TPA: hypothetical protein VMJ10_11085 [Kofleriaceae bacterium]|nr:hypothetical protein [Kofleriaceae bacterium]
MRISIWLAALAACSSTRSSSQPDAAAASPDAPGTPDAPVMTAPHQLGTVTAATYVAQCTNPGATGSTAAGFRCAELTVSCPGLDDAQVEVALAPASRTPKGVVVTHSGSDGMTFIGNQLEGPWLEDGFSLAQIAWFAPWECGKHAGSACAVDTTPPAERASMVDAGCRPATVIQWIHDSAQLADGTPFLPSGTALCGHGASGGSGAFWYSLLQYGRGAALDYVILAASSPFGRIDIGCDANNAATQVPAPCDNFATPPMAWEYDDANGAGSTAAFNRWLSTTTCGAAGGPSADEAALFARSSVLADGADLDIATPVTTYDCVDAASLNVVPGGGHFVHDALRANDPTGAKWKGVCVVTGAGGNGTCKGEEVFQDPTMRATAIADMETNCVPLQR